MILSPSGLCKVAGAQSCVLYVVQEFAQWKSALQKWISP